MSKTFFKKYFHNKINLLKIDDETIKKLEKIKKLLKIIKRKRKKVIIFGNGGSAAIANHFSVDLTKVSEIRCVNFNESSLLTCFSNDFGYENWVKKTLEYHADKGDLIILISSSGESKNMLNAVTAAKKMKFSKVVTFTGFDINNSLKNRGDINIWIDSKMYNVIENSHQFYLLLLVDMIKKFKK